MTLTLTITNAERLANGAPLHIVLDRVGAVIGRSARCDWSLPDTENYISSRHCEIGFANGEYILTDVSTNGTLVNGAATRMTAPHPIARGDHFMIGHYDIVATLTASVDPYADTLLDPEDTAPAVEPDEQSPSDDPIETPPSMESNDVESTGKADRVIDDATPVASPEAMAPDIAGAAPPPRPVAAPAPTPQPVPVAPPAQPTAPPVPAALIETFAAAAGLDPGQFKSDAEATVERAGMLLRHLIAGLVTLVDARARAKSEMGAEQTALSFDGNNPIKFARKPEQALAQLLNPKERGFMDGGAAVDDAFDDLEAHQLATLKAMQGALRATLDRFSPSAIRSRAETRGLMARIMPHAREAALWQAYEREFAGVAQGSNDAFIDVFAREFRQAYLDLARQPG